MAEKYEDDWFLNIINFESMIEIWNSVFSLMNSDMQKLGYIR